MKLHNLISMILGSLALIAVNVLIGLLGFTVSTLIGTHLGLIPALTTFVLFTVMPIGVILLTAFETGV